MFGRVGVKGTEMHVTEEQRQLLALCAIRVGDRSPDWSVIARAALRPGGLGDLASGTVPERSREASVTRDLIRKGLGDLATCLGRVDYELDLAAEVGARLVTVLDDDYPHNLRLIYNLPPFLFIRGRPFGVQDSRSVAVVGTRAASTEGRNRACRLAERLVQESVVVVSGLAYGIDQSAHRATLDAGGRTIAVIGTGITRCYPAAHLELSDEIAERGTLVSQFWPSSPPAKWTFPRRNVVMSGISQGTAVVEASATSGAKMQARLALEHGKRVFLLHSLVTAQPWARDYVARRGAVEVETVEEIVRRLAAPERIRDVASARQLALDLS